MESIFGTASFWLFLAIVSAVTAYHLGVAIAVVEICVGVVVAAGAEALGLTEALGADQEWLRFLAAAGAVLLTFLAGAELEPGIIRAKFREVTLVGLVSFSAPFIGCAVLAYWALDWDLRASLLAGVALSTTSMAVVYAVMLDTGLNQTAFGKGLLGACFVTDLGTVIALGLLFSPFTLRTVLFVVVMVGFLFLLPRATRWLTRSYGRRTAAIRAKWVILVVFALGSLALWSGSEAVLPAYLVGMALAEFSNGEMHWIRRMRTLTVGFLTPFYFIRAGTFVSLRTLAAAPLVFLVLLGGKVATKIFGLYPLVGLFHKDRQEKWYYTLLMSTGLTFGTISALFGLTHGIVTREQYSFLVAAVIASAVVPTLIASAAFHPAHLVPAGRAVEQPPVEGLNEEG
jgi:glutathione-regulated potassium-efflux system ancillary protein KefC